jgi:D-glycero-alpha-D-manno-heptose-7-phosphate kinase
MERLERRLLLFFTGTARHSASILTEQRRATRDGNSGTIDALHQIKATAAECRVCLEKGDVDGVGQLLRDGWQQKKRLATGVSNTWLDEVYGVAMARGAVGGKITGAGGGGFLLLYCHEEFHDDVTTALELMALRRMDFRLTNGGVSVAGMQWDDDQRVREVDTVALKYLQNITRESDWGAHQN